MKNEAGIKEELIELTKDLTEHLIYMRELGIDYLGEQIQDESKLEEPKVFNAALERNAKAAEKIEAAKPVSTRSFIPPPSFTKREVPIIEESKEMPKEKTKQASSTPPPPQETLFGTVTPKDEDSLPKLGETFEDIREDIGNCIRCPLHEGRTQIVHSTGNTKARLMFIGEAPGADEDAQGKPFVGRAGQLLTKIIEAIGMKREDVFIGNVNRCRPPQNRTPTTAEAHTCKPFLLREIAIVQPEVIVVLGNTAMKNLLDTKEGITKIRGQFQNYKGIQVMPTFHPAYLLRDPSKKREAWEDMKKVREYLDSKRDV
jgi:uracil-DNA glycosylase